MVRCLTVMAGCWFSPLVVAPAISDPQDVEEDGKNAASSDNSDDPSNNGGSGRIADGRGTVTALNPSQTAGQRDQHAVNRALEHAAEKIRQTDRMDGLANVSGPGKIEHFHSNRSPAQDTDEVGVHTQQRHHQN